MYLENKNPAWPGWETVRLIGRGSFGAVYEIRREAFGHSERAALKVISIPQSNGDINEMRADGIDEESISETLNDHLKSIVDEYYLMREMNGSANVVNCDDVLTVQHEDGLGWDIFIKMELLTPLTDTLPAEIPAELAIKIGIQLCRALELCKKHNIVHRDIKPQNIFYSANGDYKLGDFGIAKTVEKTMGGTKTGTYKYMAPEVYNNQPYGSGADIYSLGLVLYWLLNERRLPFLPLPPEKVRPGMDEEARSKRFSGEPIPAPKNGSEEFKRIVLKACAFNTDDRYHTADEMLADLENLRTAARRGPFSTPEDIQPDEDRSIGPNFANPANHVVGAHAKTEDMFQTAGMPEAGDEETVSAVHASELYEKEDETVSVFSRPGPTAQPAEQTTATDRHDAKRKIDAGHIKVEQQAKQQKKNVITSLTIAAVCIAILLVGTKVMIPNNKYNNAVALMNAGEYEQAIEVFEALEGYKDSAVQIENCQTGIKENAYADAVALMNAGEYEQAITAFGEINNYKDSTECAVQCIKMALAEQNPKVGDTITFGTYEQDGNTANGQEGIEWIVLEKEDDRILVVSKYALDCQPYNTYCTAVTWETCTLRKWLNGIFREAAFSDAERACIPTVTVTADKNPEYSTNPGNSTQDQIFLLSINEAEKYFNTNDARMCAATEYAVAQGAYTNDDYTVDGKATCWWWLRSPGYGSDYAANVLYGGSVGYYGRGVGRGDVAVRPALWINLES